MKESGAHGRRRHRHRPPSTTSFRQTRTQLLHRAMGMVRPSQQPSTPLPSPPDHAPVMGMNSSTMPPRRRMTPTSVNIAGIDLRRRTSFRLEPYTTPPLQTLGRGPSQSEPARTSRNSSRLQQRRSQTEWIRRTPRPPHHGGLPESTSAPPPRHNYAPPHHTANGDGPLCQLQKMGAVPRPGHGHAAQTDQTSPSQDTPALQPR